MSQLNEMEESGLILKHVLVSTPPKVVVYEINLNIQVYVK